MLIRVLRLVVIGKARKRRKKIPWPNDLILKLSLSPSGEIHILVTTSPLTYICMVNQTYINHECGRAIQ